MTSLHTTDDLLRAARENQEFREAFRREILTEELINLPQCFEEHVSETTKSINALTLSIAELTKRMDQMTDNIEHIGDSHRREHDALHRFRGNYAIEATRNRESDIAELFAEARGIRRFRLRALTREERDDLFDENLDAIDRLDTEGNISKSFPEGDIIARASYKRQGDAIFYIAVEASYTVNADDVLRASDHAKILRESTGRQAFAVVSGIEVNHRIGDSYERRITKDLTEYLESGRDDEVFWFQLTDSELEPLPPS